MAIDIIESENEKLFQEAFIQTSYRNSSIPIISNKIKSYIIWQSNNETIWSFDNYLTLEFTSDWGIKFPPETWKWKNGKALWHNKLHKLLFIYFIQEII